MIMKTWFKSLISVSLSLMCLFAGLGYAAVSTSLAVSGNVRLEMPEGIFITDITSVRSSNTEENSFDYIAATTNVKNRIRKADGDAAAVVEYEVTVYNNTSTTYYYRDVYFQPGLPEYSANDYISDTQAADTVHIECVFEDDSDDAKKLSPREAITFRVIYTVGEELGADESLNMLVNIRFGIHVSGEGEAIGKIEARFLEILNTPSTYSYLLDVLDNKFDGQNDWTSNYVGNVAGAYEGRFSDDSIAVNTLFQNQLQMTIDGEDREATVIIKHEDVDWLSYTGDDYVAVHPSGASMSFSGCEMTLYLTIDDLATPNSVATVYAMVFTCDIVNWETYERGPWYRLGTIFVGIAPVVDYVSGQAPGTGSFQTTGWYPIASSYEVMQGYHFEIRNGGTVDVFHMDPFSYNILQMDKNFLHWHLESSSKESIDVMKALLYDAERILYNKNYAGEGVDRLRAVYEKYYWTYAYLSSDPSVNTWPYDTAGKFHPAMEELYKAVNVALTNMSKVS